MNKKFQVVDIVYTRYEDSIIRKVRNFRIVGSLLQHLFRWLKSLYYTLKIISFKHIDEIICLNPIVGIFLGIMNFKHTRIILGGFLFEPKNNNIYYRLRKKITGFALKRIDKAVVYGSKEVTYYKNIFDLKDKFIFVPYGIDYLNQIPYEGKSLPEKFIFSGGGSNRDYETLSKAYACSSKRLPLVIATQPWRLDELELSNVYILTNVVNETFGDVLKKAELLILSLKDSDISAGHMVMLQAMKLGVPIIVNDIPAIHDYVDQTMVVFYKSGDIKGLCKTIDKYDKEQINNKQRVISANEKYNNEYTSFGLVKRLLELT